MTVISASRRTDIPAFHAEWFMDKIARGRCQVANPFNGRVETVALDPGSVEAIVFWTRNPGPLTPHLPSLWRRGYRFYVTLTITGYPKELEPGCPPAERAAALARDLAGRYGPHAVVWRYDPILLTSVTGAAWHRQNFSRLLGLMEGAVNECVISFADFYKKVERNLASPLARLGAETLEPGWDELRALAADLAKEAGERGVRLTACCEPELGLDTAPASSCVDPARLAAVSGKDFSALQKNPTRPGCGCAASKDIGAYDTCPAGCAYCYANHSPGRSANNAGSMDPRSLALAPAADRRDSAVG